MGRIRLDAGRDKSPHALAEDGRPSGTASGRGWTRPRRRFEYSALTRHASIQTMMNVYGRVMTDGKRQARGNVVENDIEACRHAARQPNRRSIAPACPHAPGKRPSAPWC